jgi:lipopolysaccharide biosynthesis glycosyltransferase
MVSVTSILINANNSTFIYFHFLIGNDVNSNNINKILSLKKMNYNSKFKFHKVGNTFKGWIHGKKKLTVASFYRSILPELINDVNKIIYLDGDTLIYNDLTGMYQLNMNNLYFRGVHEIVSKNNEKNLNKRKYICAGVMLMNLKLMRKDHVFIIFKNYYYKYYKQKIYYGDQHIINDLFKDKIGFLPPKYGIWFINQKDIQNYKKLNPLIYTEQELKESINNPVIRHMWGNTNEGFLYEKPWLLRRYFKIKEEWNYYAKKTGYYSEICQFFKNACVNLHKKNVII